jgi:uncharacterized protein (TIRG00374 family)
VSSKFFAGSVTQRIAVKAKDPEMQGSPSVHGVAKEGSSYVDQPAGALMSGCAETEGLSAGESTEFSISQKKNRAYYWTAGGIVTFAILVALLSLSRDSHQVYEYFGKIDAQILIFMLSLSMFNYLGRILRWHYFSREIGIDVPLTQNGLYYVAGFSMAITPGKVGEALRLWLLRRSHSIPYDRTIGLLIADRLSDAGALLLICLIGAFGFPPGAGQLVTVALIGMVIIGLTLLFLKPVALIEATGWVYGRVKRGRRQFARARRALRHLARLGSWRVYGGTLMLASLGWFAEAFALHQLMLAFGSPQPLLQIMFVFSVALLVGVAAMLPGGLGGTEISMVGLLVAMGVDMEAAIAATAIIRLTTLWFSVLVGFLALPVALWVAGKKVVV